MDRLGGHFGPDDADDYLDHDVEEHDAAHGAHEAPPSPVGQDERRMQVRAYNHWASLLADRHLPNIEDLIPEELEDFGPYSVLLDFSMGIEDPAVQYLGDKLGAECEGGVQRIETLSDVPSRSLLSRITDHYMQILANQAPIGFEAEFVNRHGLTVLYRGILLPYSSDDQTIDFIYGVINWKEMADAETADALLLEIDQALGDYDDGSGDTDSTPCLVETAEMLTEQAQRDAAAASHERDVLDLAQAEVVADEPAAALPSPVFGQDDEDDEDEGYDETRYAAFTGATAARTGRGVDALGNPIGAGPQQSYDEDFAETDDGYGSFDSGMKTAADYGLPDWDDEAEEDDDVDGVVDPLADEETSTSLISLVSRGMRTKKAVDLSAPDVGSNTWETEAESEPAADVPQAYEGADIALPAYDPELYAPVFELAADDVATEAEVAPQPIAEAAGSAAEIHTTILPEGEAPEGLYDYLAAAREQALAALSTEDRSRKALYAAVGLAYDFSREAAANPADYAELIADNGLTVQDRAPMTPIVKLVFGAEYDKTRLTEYAAVLTYAHRIGVERGALPSWLRAAEGGLKGVVAEERRARREEQGKPVEDRRGVRSALAKKLRSAEPLAFADLADDGPEFALVMVRRTAGGDLVVIGEVPEDIALLEKAARKLLG